MTNRDLFQKTDHHRPFIQDHRALTREEIKELDTSYKIDTTYSSNALEGNSFVF